MIWDYLNVSAKTTQSLSKIKLGQGVVGKSTSALIIFIIAAVVLAFICRGTKYEWLLVLIVILCGAFFFMYLWKIFAFADKHPEAAVMEGAEYSQFKQAELASKSGAHTEVSPLLKSEDVKAVLAGGRK